MNWADTILSQRPPEEIWNQVATELLRLARTTASPVELHQTLVPADRLLAESAWELWSAFPTFSGRTSARLIDWWNRSAAGGRAVLILDALSLRDLPALLGGAQARNIQPKNVAVTGSEVPSDTTPFAKALGATSRASLQHNGATASFALSSDQLHTDVLNIPFADCPVPPTRDVFIWHEWQDAEVVAKLKEAFGASRLRPASEPWPHPFLPPTVQHANGHDVVVGQVKWRVQSGFPPRCHGGLSLLEVAVPWLEFPPN